ncbi:unnamed protein product [Closterium sp. NIES-54]
MVCHRLVSSLPEPLAPLPRSSAPPCIPCVEGRQRAAPHSSSFPPTTAPLQTLHLDVWGPSPVLGPRQERYFLIVVDDYSRYTTVFPLRRKADVPTILEPWLLARGAPPPSRPARSGVSHVTPQSSPPQRPVPVVSWGAGGAVAEGEGTGASGALGASSGGVGGVRVETTPEEDTGVLTQRPCPASPPGFPSVPQFPPRSPPRPVAVEPGGVPARGTGVPGGVACGGSGSGGAGARDTSTATPTLRTGEGGVGASLALPLPTVHLVSGPARSPFSGGAPVFPPEVLEDRQFELGFLVAAIPHLCTMLLAPEGDPDALDIPIPRNHAEAVSGPWASYWIAAKEAVMASYSSTGTYVDAVPPPGANVFSGMWLHKVKQLPRAPPVFKARYVARGFSQREGVDFFQTFAPTPKMTTLWVFCILQHSATTSYDLSTAFLHEQI